MAHPNKIYNADFAQDLDGWTIAGGAVHVANQGHKELGACYLANSGDAISRDFGINMGREYMLEVAVKGSGSGSVTLTITNDEAETVYTTSLTVTAAWALQPATRVGLPWGTHTLSLAYDDVAVYVDDVSIAYVVKTRAELAAIVADRLGVLATNASMDTTPDGDDTEGDYTQAVDEGLRAVRACDPAGRVDVRYLEPDDLTACLGHIELAMLNKLHRHWVTKTDYSLGPRSEHLSQINQALLALTGAAVGGRPASAGRGVQQRQLIHKGTYG